MNSKQGRKQTTKGLHKRKKKLYFNKGIWLGKDESEPFLIMDVEGTDSISHWGEKFFFMNSKNKIYLVRRRKKMLYLRC